MTIKIGQIYQVGKYGSERYSYFLAMKEKPAYLNPDKKAIYGLEYTRGYEKGKFTGKPYAGNWSGRIEAYSLNRIMAAKVRKREIIQREMIKVVFGKYGPPGKYKLS